MAMKIEANIFGSKKEQISPLETKINDPKDTSDTLILEKLVSLETFTVDFQEEGEQVIDQQNASEKSLDEVFQEQGTVENTTKEMEPEQDEAIHEPISHVQQEDDEVIFLPFQDSDDTLSHDSKGEGEIKSSNNVDILCFTIEDEGAIYEDETMMHVEDTQVLKDPAQEETVSYPPLHDFDDSLLYDLVNEEEMDESLNVLNPPCYDTDTDLVDIDEFIHVGRRKWDVVGFDIDPIYDIENHFQVLLSQLSQNTFDFNQ
jgi:hypothetical protein